MIIEKQSAEVLKKSLAQYGVEITFEVAQQVHRDLVRNDIPMSRKEMKKARQQYHREANKMFQGYEDKLIDRFGKIEEILKDKPKYFPQFLWAVLSGIFINKEKVETKLSANQPQ